MHRHTNTNTHKHQLTWQTPTIAINHRDCLVADLILNIHHSILTFFCHTQTNNVSQSHPQTLQQIKGGQRGRRKQDRPALIDGSVWFDEVSVGDAQHFFPDSNAGQQRREKHIQSQTHQNPLRLNPSHHNWQTDVKWGRKKKNTRGTDGEKKNT